MRSLILSGFILSVSLGAATGSAQPYYDPDILALVQAHGCTDCHGGSGGMFITPYSNVFTTGNHAPIVVPGDSNSVIVQKLKGTAPFGARMPFGGPFLTPAEIQVFVQWIMNGALESAVAAVPGESGVPAAFRLEQNYPNPFNPTTSIRFQVPVAGDVKLAVFDHLGREVAELANGRMDAGTHEATFDAGGFASGVYMYRLQVRPVETAGSEASASTPASFVQTRKMMLVK